MAKIKSSKNTEVSAFLDDLKHPLRKEIETLRTLILSCETNLEESIKWNGPNYAHNSEDRITMKIQPPKLIHLIFHTGAKKQALPKAKLIDTKSKLLEWKDNSRAVIALKTLAEITAAEKELTNIVKEWLAATK